MTDKDGSSWRRPPATETPELILRAQEECRRFALGLFACILAPITLLLTIGVVGAALNQAVAGRFTWLVVAALATVCLIATLACFKAARQAKD